jgi:hypothetical protein
VAGQCAARHDLADRRGGRGIDGLVLPDLEARSDGAHPTGVAPAMIELHGHGIASQDGAFFVAPDAEGPRKPPPERAYIIARLVD